jgi:hypothetical protein
VHVGCRYPIFDHFMLKRKKTRHSDAQLSAVSSNVCIFAIKTYSLTNNNVYCMLNKQQINMQLQQVLKVQAF